MKIRIREHIVPNQEPVYFIEYFEPTGLFFGGEWKNIEIHRNYGPFTRYKYYNKYDVTTALERILKESNEDKEYEKEAKQREKDTKNNIIKEI